MKKSILLGLLFIVLMGLSACAVSNAPMNQPEYGYIPLSGLEWGMTKEEILDTLHLTEDQITTESEQVFTFHPDQSLLNGTPDTIAFTMDGQRVAGLDGTPRLIEIGISYQETGDDVFSRLKAELAAQYGDPSDKRSIVETGPNQQEMSLSVSTNQPPEFMAYWYSADTLETKMSSAAAEPFRESLEVVGQWNGLENDENWTLFLKNLNLTSIVLDCREDAPFNLDKEIKYSSLIFNGTGAYYARLLNEKYSGESTAS